MKIEQKAIKVRDIFESYADNGEGGVVGYGGKLNIRPAYQREFVYKDAQRDAVIATIRKGFPLNVMYWVDHEDGTFEVLDGQQRTLSFCQYINGDFSIAFRYFHNLTPDEKEAILDYELTVYWCSGTDSEKLAWFEIVNVAGQRLTDQELRNATFTGLWLSDAKAKFSRPGCPAYAISKDYVRATVIDQSLLERALKWRSQGAIQAYMAEHQKDPSATELWLYFKRVIDWVQATFPNTRAELMKKVEWGPLYDAYNKDNSLDSDALEAEISALLAERDVTSKHGVYKYILTREERYLSVRAFDDDERRAAYERQKGICVKCEEHFDIKDMEADHANPWSKGGRTTAENCQMLCKPCNRRKSDV
jgi:Protein of unknown function DUF262/HNH endonuclease